MHFVNSPKDNKALQKMVGKSSLTKHMEEKEEEHDRYEVFEAIDTLTDAARELYCSEEKDWEDICTELSKSILKLKNKEKKLEDLE